MEEIRWAKMMCELDLFHLQENWDKEKEKVCDEVYMQLTSDLLARDKQNQNEGYVLG